MRVCAESNHEGDEVTPTVPAAPRRGNVRGDSVPRTFDMETDDASAIPRLARRMPDDEHENQAYPLRHAELRTDLAADA